MAGLTDFAVQGDSPSISDFAPDKDVVAPVGNPPSNLNMAAHATVLTADPQSMVPTFQAINSEQAASGQSQTADDLTKQAQQRAFSQSKQQLTTLLADPNISDEQKQAAINGVYDQSSKMYEPHNLVSAEAIQAPVANETPEAENVRIDYAASIDKSNETKLAQQALVNAYSASKNPDTSDKVLDVLSSLVPFSQGVNTARINSELTKQEGGGTAAQVGSYLKGFFASGMTQADIRDKLLNLPDDEKPAFTQNLIDIVNNSSTVSLRSQNDMAKAQFLQNFVTTGAYGSGSEWADNAASILDATIVGGPLLREAQAGRSASTASKAAAAEEAVGEAWTKGYKGPGEAPTGSQGPTNPRGGPTPQGQVHDTILKAQNDIVRSDVQPATVSQNIKDVNPDKFRNVHEAAASDPSDNVSQALYGTTMPEAVANDILPEIANPDASVKAKVGTPELINNINISPDPELAEFLHNDGKIMFTDDEKARFRADTVTDFQNAFEVGERKEMFQVLHMDNADTAGGVKIKAVYGPQSSGYANPQEAVDLAKFAFRKYGIGDENITLLKRDGGQYLPIDKKAVGVVGEGEPGTNIAPIGGDYLVQVDHDATIGTPAVWDRLDPTKDFLNRLPVFNGSSGQGSFTRHLLDNASIQHPTVSMAAAVGVNKSAGLDKVLLKLGDKFTKQVAAMHPEAQTRLFDAIEEANHKSIEFNFMELAARGMTPRDLDALRSFREFYDNAWYLENRDTATTMSAQGYKEFVHVNGDTRLFARPRGLPNKESVKIWDHETGLIRQAGARELEELYNKGGTLATVRQPIRVGDDVAEHIMSREHPTGGYLKTITPDTRILHYRPGYYSVTYTDPHFIIKRERDGAGNHIYDRAVATAANIPDAKVMTARLQSTDPTAQAGDYFHRHDKSMTPKERSNHDWDVSVTSGRSAQRIRGKRLADANSSVANPAMGRILNPVESMVNSARSISRRTAMRPVIESIRGRILDAGSDLGVLPKDEYGRPFVPTSVNDIKDPTGKISQFDKRIANLRTQVEYLGQLERGYINMIDDATKAGLNMVADILGNRGLGKMEEVTRNMAKAGGPAQKAKSVAYTLYLALNPLRQFVVQGHQAVQLLAVNPRWILSAHAAPHTAYIIGRQIGFDFHVGNDKMFQTVMGMTRDEADNMFKQFERSGATANIDKHNLVKGAMMDIADRAARKNFGLLTPAKKFGRAAGGAVGVARKVGFDAGENINQVTSWLAFRDLAVRAGKDINKADEIEKVAGQAINFTYNMNSAGDMPYNANLASVALQFQQVPHKFLTTMTTNRILNWKQKSSLMLTNFALYGTGISALGLAGYSGYEAMMPKDPKYRQALEDGLEGTMLNKAASMAVGQDTRINWKGLAPSDMYGTYDMVHGLFTGNVGDFFAKSPAGSIFFGQNSRMAALYRDASEYFHVTDDHNLQNPVTFGQIMQDVAKLSSGYSNLWKASYIMEHQKKMATSSLAAGDQMNSAYAYAQAFGMSDMDSDIRRSLSMEMQDKQKQVAQDVDNYYKNIKQDLLRDGMSRSEMDYIKIVHNEFWRSPMYQNDFARDRLEFNLLKDLQDGDDRFYRQVLKSSGVMSKEELDSIIRRAPDGDGDKDQLLHLNATIHTARDLNETEK